VRNRQSHRDKQNPQQQQIKLADLEMLELAAVAGEIELQYLDESGLQYVEPSRLSEKHRCVRVRQVTMSSYASNL